MNPSWEWQLIAKHDSLTEGPAWDGSGLLYNECYASTTYRWDPETGESSVWRTGTNQANGMKFDRSGRLFACEGGANRVVELDTSDATDKATVIADNLDGARINMPNDLDIDGRGRIYFSDPNYSAEPSNLPHESVYLAEHIFGGNWTVKRVTFDTNRPNGVLLSADQSILYVAESPVVKSYRRQFRAYPVNPDGTLGDKTVLFDFGVGRGIDGMALNTDGQIVATAGSNAMGAGPAIYIFEPDGLVRATHRTPADSPTNCTFGGPGLDTLYVTFATGHVYEVRNTGMTGHLAYPRRMF
jgi:gluconolactonase